MTNYVSLIPVPNSVNAPLPMSNQVPNSAGGFVYKLSPMGVLKRFIMIGATGSTFYATQQKSFDLATDAIDTALQHSGIEFIETLLLYSLAGRIPKQDPALYAYARGIVFGSPDVKAYALSRLSEMCRIPTHLFSLLTYVKAMGGKLGGRSWKRALAAWYTSKKPSNLAYHLIKYRQRGGWTHADVLRIAKPAGFNTGSSDLGDLFAFATGKEIAGSGDHLNLINSFKRLQTKGFSQAKAVREIKAHGMPWEAIPDSLLDSKEVWKAILMPSDSSPSGMPLGALIRHLNKFTNLGMFEEEDVREFVVKKLTDAASLQSARINPLQLLVAARTYSTGLNSLGTMRWVPVPFITQALETGFERSFKYVPSNGKSYAVGLDVSGSMTWSKSQGMNLTCMDAASALAKIFSVSENTDVWAFSSKLTPLSKELFTSPLRNIYAAVANLPHAATNIGIVIQEALKTKKHYDVFILLTDNEVNAGQHTYTVLQEYRKLVNPNAKVVVVAMELSEFSVANPADGGMLDVAGFDPAIPAIISEFIEQ